ncbi:MAG: RNA-binding domain-containing protein [Candidatus Hadarchaeales archaeon]
MGYRAIGIVGPQGSGKTEVAKLLASRGAAIVRMGDVVWEETRRRGLPINEENVGKVAADLREKLGPAAVAKLCIPIVSERKAAAHVIVDGIRSGEEVEEFRSAFGHDFRLVSVVADRRIRALRVLSRKREDDVRSEEEFLEKERREMAWGLEDAMRKADFTMTNEGTLEELRGKVDALYRRLVGKGLRISVEAEVRPTESREKVEEAVRKLFPAVSLVVSEGKVMGESGDINSLSTLHRLLRQQAILDAARSIMISNLRENRTLFMLNKQVAYMGRVSFTDGESPLGPIVVTIDAEDPRAMVDFLAPKTKDGRPVAEVDYG